MQFSQLLRATVLAAALCGTTAAAHAATFTVTKLSDSNDGACNADCSLREAIGAVNAATTNSVIEFASPLFDKARTIPLEKGSLVINHTVDISGPLKGILTLDAGHKSRVFDLEGGIVNVNRVVMANGLGGPGQFTPLTEGGCVFANNGISAFTRCVFIGGSAQLGGGVFVNNGITQLMDCTIVGNSAVTPPAGTGQAAGGGVYCGGAFTVMRNCTVVNNSARSDNPLYGGFGGGMANNGNTNGFSVRDTIVAYNTVVPQKSGTVGAPDVGGPFGSSGYNLIRRLGDAGSSSGFISTDVLGADPGFELDAARGNIPWLKDNGGATLTIAINMSGSAYGRGYSLLGVDQRDYPRNFGGGSDIGAYELNHAPTITSVSLTPTAPSAGQAITATVVATDIDGTEPTCTIVWKRTRGGKTSTLPDTGTVLSSNQNLPGDIITATATAHDGFADSAPQSASVTLVNSPISISSLAVQPKNPFTFEKMVATVQTSDVDKSRPYFTFVWTKNGVVQQTVNTRTNQDFYDLNVNDHGDKGDVIEVTVTANDGGIPATSASAKYSTTVLNSVPTMAALTLSPQAPAPGGAVTISYSGRDADGDVLTKIIVWKVNGKVLPTEKTSRLDLAKYPDLKIGDVISAEMRLSDGAALSKTLSASATVTAPPVDPPTPPVTASASGNAA